MQTNVKGEQQLVGVGEALAEEGAIITSSTVTVLKQQQQAQVVAAEAEAEAEGECVCVCVGGA